MPNEHSRRQFISLMLAGAFAPLVVSCSAPRLSQEEKQSENPGDIFFNLSCLLTGRQNLDRHVSDDIYKRISTEPWAEQYLRSIYQVVRRAPLDSNEIQLDASQSWFINHVLTTWYTGVYYYENQPAQRINNYQQSLMFDVIKAYMPVPMLLPTGYGSWSELPSTTPWM